MDYPHNQFNHKHLTEEDIQFFISNGYLNLKSIIPPEECHRYDQEVIQPALLKHANLNEHDESTWFVQNNPKLKTMLTQPMISNNGDDDNGDSGIPIGLMVRDPENREHECDPIPLHDAYWSALFDSERLNGILDELHGVRSVFPDDNVSSMSDEQEGAKIHNQKDVHRRRWEYLHPGSVGWIHVRLPILRNKSVKSFFETQDDDNNDGNKYKEFYVPKNEQTWHVDGGHFSPHRLASPEQSVILLPCLRNIDSNCGGGNTVLLSGSHRHIAQLLRNNENDREGEIGETETRTGTGVESKKDDINDSNNNEKNGIDKDVLNSYCEELVNKWPEEQIVEAGPSSAGDIWLLHPFLVHSAGRNTRAILETQMHDEGGRNNGTSNASNVSSFSSHVDYFRLTFNIGTRWKEHKPLPLLLSTASQPHNSLDTDKSLEDDNNKQTGINGSNNSNKTPCMSILEWTIFEGSKNTQRRSQTRKGVKVV